MSAFELKKFYYVCFYSKTTYKNDAYLFENNMLYQELLKLSEQPKLVGYNRRDTSWYNQSRSQPAQTVPLVPFASQYDRIFEIFIQARFSHVLYVMYDSFSETRCIKDEQKCA